MPVLDEYPRPQLQRNSYLCLNGNWEYQIVKNNQKAEYQGTILVPYSPEAKASMVNKTLMPNEELWYKRSVTIHNDFINERIILNFGAVDQI